MINSMSPQRLYNVAMWLISFIFAGFLMGLGELVIADLPRYGQAASISELGGHRAAAPSDPQGVELKRQLMALQNQREQAQVAMVAAQQAFTAANEAHQNWLRTREVTATSANASEQDPELLTRLKDLQKLGDKNVAAKQTLSAVDEQIRVLNEQTQARAFERANAPEAVAQRRWDEMRNFLMRLALTLPLLGFAGWLIAKKRKSAYWPLGRGFVIFAGSAFFFELVPYLPSYGGYVRTIVGILLCVIGGHYGIRWMQGYLKRREEEERRNEAERRRSMNREAAIAKMNAGLCPGCDRAITKSIGSEHVNHCVHCGLKLFDVCHALVPNPTHTRGLLSASGYTATTGSELAMMRCGTRKNAYYAHCQSCGSPAGAAGGTFAGATSDPGNVRRSGEATDQAEDIGPVGLTG